jgi:hypothetical protein
MACERRCHNRFYNRTGARAPMTGFSSLRPPVDGSPILVSRCREWIRAYVFITGCEVRPRAAITVKCLDAALLLVQSQHVVHKRPRAIPGGRVRRLRSPATSRRKVMPESLEYDLEQILR